MRPETPTTLVQIPCYNEGLPGRRHVLTISEELVIRWRGSGKEQQ